MISERSLELMRADKQWQEWFLAVHRPEQIWQALVNGDQARTEVDIPFVNATWSATAYAHFTLYLYDRTTDELKGTVKLRGNVPAAAAGTLEVSMNDLDFNNNDEMIIKREIRPVAIQPSLENDLEDVDHVYPGFIDPLARIGPPACVFLEGGEAIANWHADNAVFEDGATIASENWTFVTGAPVGTTNRAGSPDNPVQVRYDSPGQHYLWHVVVDSNGRFHSRNNITYVFDDPDTPSLTGDYPIREFSIESLSGDLEGGGWMATVRVWEDCDESQFSDLAQVVVFNRQHWYDMSADCDCQEDLDDDWAYRGNIALVGWIAKDSVRKDPETGDTVFEVLGPGAILKTLTCWGAGFRDVAAGADWHDIINMNLNKCAHHVLTEHTTLSYIADCFLELYDSDGNDIGMDSIDFQESDPYDQIKVQIGEAGRAVFASNRLGQLYLQPNLQLEKLAVRAAVDLSGVSLEHGDWRDELNLGEEPATKAVCQVDFIGFTEDLTPYYSLSPGRQFSTGRVQKITGVRVSDQTEANVYGGLFQGWHNSEFKNVGVPMRGYWPVGTDVVPQRYVGLTLDEDDTNRGLVWDNTRHIVRQISVSVNAEGPYALTDLVLEQESYGLPGLTNIVPDEPDLPPPDQPTPPPPPPPIDYNGRLRRAILHTSQGAFITKNFHLPNPVWEASNNNLGTNARTSIRELVFDFSDGDRAFMVSRHATDGGAFRCNDIWDQSAWSRRFDGPYVLAAINAGGCPPPPAGGCPSDDPNWNTYTFVHADIGCDPTTGDLVIIAGAEDGGVQGWNRHKRAFYSSDALATLTLGDGLWHDPCPGNCGHMSTPNTRGITITGGTALLTYICAWGFGGDFHRGISTDGGAVVNTATGEVTPWAVGTNAGHTRVGNVVIFWHGNDLTFSEDTGLTFDSQLNLLPGDAGTSTHALSIHFLDTGNVLMAPGGPSYSTDGGWTWGACGAVVANAYCCAACADPTFIPDGAGFIVGCALPAADSWLYLTSSLGAAWVNKSGNLEDFLTNGVDRIYGIIPVQDS